MLTYSSQAIDYHFVQPHHGAHLLLLHGPQLTASVILRRQLVHRRMRKVSEPKGSSWNVLLEVLAIKLLD